MHCLRSISLFLLVLLSTLIMTCPALAARYIVDSQTSSVVWSTAEWTNYPQTPTCVPVTPLAAMQNAKPGDIVYFRGGDGGNYNLTMNTNYMVPALNPTNNGVAASPITFTAYPGETPHLYNSNDHGQPGWDFPTIGGYGKSWIIWDGFKLSASNASGRASFYNSSDCILRNTEVIGAHIPAVAWGEGNYDGVRINGSTRITIQNCYIHDVYDTGSDHGNGIKLYSGTDIVVEHCTFSNNNSAICDKDSGINNIYRYNFIQGTGFVIGNYAGGIPANIHLYNNIILVNDSAMDAIITENCQGINIYNNTIVNSHWALNLAGASNQRIWNNIIYRSSNAAYRSKKLTIKQGQPDYINYNCYYNGQTFKINDYEPEPVGATYYSLTSWQTSNKLIGDQNPDTNSIYQDPSFSNNMGTDAASYRLSLGSPCKGKGSGFVDMGAYPNPSEALAIGYKPVVTFLQPPKELRMTY